MTISSKANAAAPGSISADGEKASRRNAALRMAAHVAAWMPFVCAGAFLVRRDWRPVSDAAATAVRSWDVLTAHGPMVGQGTARLAQGIYDPGPVQYWLLTLPVHLDPQHGVLLGAALWCMLAASLTVEAAWSVAGQFGALVASGIILATVLWMPGVALQPYWNPWFGVMFLLAALASAWAVMAGRRGWWPVLVITASIAAQAHLMFTFASAALVIPAFIVGLADTARDRAGYRWALIGLVAGAACWSAPALQEVTSPAGNLTALARSLATSGHKTGLAFGLKALAGSAEPPPLWSKPLQSLLDLNLIGERSAVFGAVTLAVTAAVIIAAVHPLRSRRLAALAGVSLLVSVGALVSYSGIAVQSIPAMPSTLDTLNYLMILMLPAGVLSWITVAGALVLIARHVLGRVRAPAASPTRPVTGDRDSGLAGAGERAATRRTAPAVGFAAVALLALATSLTATGSAGQFPGVADGQVARAVTIASRQIERQLPRQPIALSVVSADRNYRTRRLLLGLTWALSTRGYSPELIRKFGWELGPAYVLRGQPITHVQVIVHGSGVSVRITRPAVHPAVAGPGLP